VTAPRRAPPRTQLARSPVATHDPTTPGSTGPLLEIDYDGAEQPPPRRAEHGPVDTSIKSAIIRWLNEQL
jgi:hypothetical protein